MAYNQERIRATLTAPDLPEPLPVIAVIERGELNGETRFVSAVVSIDREQEWAIGTPTPPPVYEREVDGSILLSGERWGGWEYDPAHRTLSYQYYHVPLVELSTREALLEMIMQVAGKGWPTDVIAGFVIAVKSLLRNAYGTSSDHAISVSTVLEGFGEESPRVRL